MFDPYFGPQGLKSFDMLVNGPAADVTASGQRHLRLLVLAQHGADQIVGSPDLLDILVLHHQAADLGGVQRHAVPAGALLQHTDTLHGFQQHIGIPHIRQIVYIYGLIGHNRRSKNRKRRVFGPSYLYLAHQWITAFNCVLFHFVYLIQIYIKD